MENTVQKLQAELEYLKEEFDKQTQLLETMNEELVLQKYYMMLLVQKTLGVKWGEFINTAHKIPTEIYQHAYKETWDLSEARKLVEDIFNRNPNEQ